MGLQICLTIGIGALMIIAGIFSFRYINDKILESHNGWQLLMNTLLLFITLASILIIGLITMGLLFDFIGK